MLDYSEQGATAWLELETRVQPSTAGIPLVRSLESEGDAPGLLEDLGRLLDGLGAESPIGLSRLLQTPSVQQAMAELVAQMGLARAARFFHWLDEADLPDSHIIVAGLIEGDGQHAQALRAAVTAFAQRQVLVRLFSADRLEALQTATETALKDET